MFNSKKINRLEKHTEKIVRDFTEDLEKANELYTSALRRIYSLEEENKYLNKEFDELYEHVHKPKRKYAKKVTT